MILKRKLDNKGRLTFPIDDVLRQVGIEPNDEVSIDIIDNKIIVEKVMYNERGSKSSNV